MDACHAHDLGVLLDWVPAHFAKEGRAGLDGTPLYEHPDPRIGEHPVWGSYIFDYGRAEVRNFLLGSARFWLEEFHVDGFQVDAVASMIWLDHARPESHWGVNRHGGGRTWTRWSSCVASTPWCTSAPRGPSRWPRSTAYTWVTHLPGEPERASLGFDFKWNMGWMHDTLSTSRPTRCTAAPATSASPGPSGTPSTSSTSCPSPTTRWCTSRRPS